MLTYAPQGVQPVMHPSGDVRLKTLAGGVASAYGTSLFTGTPVKFTTDGTLIAVTAAADVVQGIFMGCQFSALQRRFVLPYWPAAQTYDAGSFSCQIAPMDTVAYFEGVTKATVAATTRGEGINLGDASQGSIFTGLSTQGLGAPTGATTATFTIEDLAPYPDNFWDDPFVKLRLKVQSPQGPVA